METIVERPGALDVHKAQVTACVRTPGRRAARGAFRGVPDDGAGLLTLRDWLAAHGVEQVTMEATGVYWKPVWAILEDEFELHARQRPSRQAGPRPQDRHVRRGVAVSARRGRAAAGELRAAQADPRRCATSPAIARRRSRSARARPTGCTRRWRTPASSSTASRRTSSASPGARCSTRWWRARPTPTCSPSSPGAGCARRSPRCAKRWRAALTHARALDRAILAHIDFLDEQIAGLTERSRSRSPLSSRPLSCCARSPAFNGAPPRSSSPRSAST